MSKNVLNMNDIIGTCYHHLKTVFGDNVNPGNYSEFVPVIPNEVSIDELDEPQKLDFSGYQTMDKGVVLLGEDGPIADIQEYELDTYMKEGSANSQENNTPIQTEGMDQSEEVGEGEGEGQPKEDAVAVAVTEGEGQPKEDAEAVAVAVTEGEGQQQEVTNTNEPAIIPDDVIKEKIEDFTTDIENRIIKTENEIKNLEESNKSLENNSIFSFLTPNNAEQSVKKLENQLEIKNEEMKKQILETKESVVKQVKNNNIIDDAVLTVFNVLNKKEDQEKINEEQISNELETLKQKKEFEKATELLNKTIAEKEKEKQNNENELNKLTESIIKPPPKNTTEDKSSNVQNRSKFMKILDESRKEDPVLLTNPELQQKKYKEELMKLENEKKQKAENKPTNFVDLFQPKPVQGTATIVNQSKTTDNMVEPKNKNELLTSKDDISIQPKVAISDKPPVKMNNWM